MSFSKYSFTDFSNTPGRAFNIDEFHRILNNLSRMQPNESVNTYNQQLENISSPSIETQHQDMPISNEETPKWNESSGQRRCLEACRQQPSSETSATKPYDSADELLLEKILPYVDSDDHPLDKIYRDLVLSPDDSQDENQAEPKTFKRQKIHHEFFSRNFKQPSPSQPIVDKVQYLPKNSSEL